MIKSEDIKLLIKKGEGLHLETKACKDKLPKDLWETYSAFANTHGGVLRIDRRSDKIVMRNPGTLRISPERIYNGDYTQARNSTIQKMLRMVGFGDNIGSGFRKILNAWKVLGYPTPDIHEEDEVNEVWLTLPLTLIDKTNDGIYDSINVTDNKNNVTDNKNNVTDNPKNVTDNQKNVTKLTIRRASILKLLKANSAITTEEIAKILKVSKRTILRDIESLTDSNVISREGGAFGGKWIIIEQQ